MIATNNIPAWRSEYQRQLQTSGPNRYREVADAELKTLGPDAYVLTGEKTRAFGGGPSPDGFVTKRGQLLGRAKPAGRVVSGGMLRA
jgi:hypothetical protein